MTLAIVAAAILAIPAWIYTVECLAGLRPVRSVRYAKAPPLAVLIPAHNEALGIERSVAAVREQLRPKDRLIVIADNCEDDTAGLAKRAGASVVERYDDLRRGKGFALAFGRKALMANPPAVVIVVDADCVPDPGALEILAAHASARNSAIQGINLVEAGRDDGPLVRISTFAFLVKNLIRQRGLRRLGAPGLLQGTGMAFPWHIFVSIALETENIVEDLDMGLELIRHGHRVEWTEAAGVRSPPASESATIAQRTRWEHGFIASAVSYVPRLFREAISQGRIGPALLALDLLVPPIALLVLFSSVAWLAAGILTLAGGGVGPVLILSVALSAIVLSTLLAWAAEGRRFLPLVTLLKVPLYIVWKVPIYARLLGRREKSWVRTARK